MTVPCKSSFQRLGAAPQGDGAVFQIFALAADSVPNSTIRVFDINYAAGGNLWFSSATSTWITDGSLRAAGFTSNDGSPGVTGSFTSADGKTITVKQGLIVGIA
jgi:hypothetical protein